MAWYKRGNPPRPLLPSLCPLRALFVTINIPDHRLKARFSSNNPRHRRIFRPPNNLDPSVKNRRGRRDTVLLIHSPAKDIHSATVEQMPASFLTLPWTDFLDALEKCWKALAFLRVVWWIYLARVNISTARAFCPKIKYVNACRKGAKAWEIGILEYKIFATNRWYISELSRYTLTGVSLSETERIIFKSPVTLS